MTMMREGAADPATPPRGRRRLFVATITVLLCGALTALATDRGFDARDDHHRADDRGEGHSAYAIGLWGDVPYSVAQEATGLPALIADMNSQNLAFTANDGDLKAGSNSLRDDALYARSRATFNSLRAPAIFTPGDNDWTDCDRVSNGSFSSLERLDHERQVFFSTPFSLGHFRIRQDVQAMPLCKTVAGFGPCVENRRWTVGGVTYATLNIQGSCNNLCGDAPDADEYFSRNQANIAWMHETFEKATAQRSAAVMLISQADPSWNPIELDAPPRNATTLAQTDTNPDGSRAWRRSVTTPPTATTTSTG